jgi:hypothetical protein
LRTSRGLDADGLLNVDPPKFFFFNFLGVETPKGPIHLGFGPPNKNYKKKIIIPGGFWEWIL